jgi:glycosyltransferase involved in cell wall biosynthesis
MSKTPLRILSISHTAHGLGSGRLRYEALAENDTIKLALVAPDRWSESRKDKPADANLSTLDIRFRAIKLPFVKGLKWYGHWYPGLGGLIREFSPDVLHLWEEPWGVVALQASVLRRLYAPKAALVFETEQNIRYSLPFPFEQIRRYNLEQADWLIARGAEAARVSAACGYKGGCTLVEYCVDRSCFRPHEPSFTQENVTEAPTAKRLKIGYVGRFIKEKGLFTVLQSLQCSSPAIEFFLMGDGPSRGELEEKARAHDLQQRVEFVQPRSAAGVAEFMHSLDALVLMSETTNTWKEQFGRVIIEAQACGTPVIGSSSGAIPYVVGDGGWIVPEGDVKALACLLDKLCTNPQLIADAKLAALENVKRFGPEKVGQDLFSAFMHAANNRRMQHASTIKTSFQIQVSKRPE